MSVLNEPHFHDEQAAFAKLESVVWPTGPVCRHCGATDRIYVLNGVRSKPSRKNPTGLIRRGLKKCGHCRKQFTARVGTVFESSHLPLHLWLQATHLLCSSKKGISAHQLHRILKVTYQAAWFASHRLREAMRSGHLAPPPMGGAGKGGIVEADETFIGRKKGVPKRRAYHHKNTVLSLVERGGQIGSFFIGNTAKTIIRDNVATEARGDDRRGKILEQGWRRICWDRFPSSNQDRWRIFFAPVGFRHDDAGPFLSGTGSNWPLS
jgi:transposase-like protein